MRIALLTGLALTAFASNSLLCRLVLGQGLIDAASFTSVRILSGAAVLGAIVIFRGQARNRNASHWRSAAMLFLYMIFFSFAYVSLRAGTGALVLFGAVQITMLPPHCAKANAFQPSPGSASPWRSQG